MDAGEDPLEVAKEAGGGTGNIGLFFNLVEATQMDDDDTSLDMDMEQVPKCMAWKLFTMDHTTTH